MKKPPNIEDPDLALFRKAVGDAQPLNSDKVEPFIDKPTPEARFRAADEQAVLAESLEPGLDDLANNSGERLRFRRDHVPERVLRRLARRHYRVEAEIDLHGLKRHEAKPELSRFLQHCRDQQQSCVRVVHGKGRGSGPAGPVLKGLVNNWLQRSNLVLAFVSTPANDGGTGAVYVLLDTR